MFFSLGRAKMINLTVKLATLIVLVLAITNIFDSQVAVAAEEAGLTPISEGNPLAVEVADLKEQLENGWKASLPADFAVISKVVTLVEQDILPLNMVKAVFQWSRKKGAANNYPFPYFQRALKIRAKKLGIVI